MEEERLNWVSMKFSRGTSTSKTTISFMVWEGNQALGPTEIYLPPHFRKKSLIVMTDQLIKKGLGRQSQPKQHVFSLPDILPVSPTTGERVFVWNQDKKKGKLHFFLAIKENSSNSLSEKTLKDLQEKILKSISQHRSPLYLTGKVKLDKVHRGKKAVHFKY